MANALNCTTRTVRTHLRTLQNTGYITIHRGKGRNGTNLYEIHIFEGDNTDLRRVENSRRAMRKNSSAKPPKEPFKGKSAPFGQMKGPLNETRTDFHAEKDPVKIRARLEQKAAERLGGWDLLMEFGTLVLDTMTEDVVSGKVSFTKAVKQIVNQVLSGSRP